MAPQMDVAKQTLTRDEVWERLEAGARDLWERNHAGQAYTERQGLAEFVKTPRGQALYERYRQATARGSGAAPPSLGRLEELVKAQEARDWWRMTPDELAAAEAQARTPEGFRQFRKGYANRPPREQPASPTATWDAAVRKGLSTTPEAECARLTACPYEAIPEALLTIAKAWLPGSVALGASDAALVDGLLSLRPDVLSVLKRRGWRYDP